MLKIRLLCRYDPDLVKDELRPLVFEQVRKQVDEEMRTLLENLKVYSPLHCAILVDRMILHTPCFKPGSWKYFHMNVTENHDKRRRYCRNMSFWNSGSVNHVLWSDTCHATGHGRC